MERLLHRAVGASPNATRTIISPQLTVKKNKVNYLLRLGLAA